MTPPLAPLCFSFSIYTHISCGDGYPSLCLSRRTIDKSMRIRPSAYRDMRLSSAIQWIFLWARSCNVFPIFRRSVLFECDCGWHDLSGRAANVGSTTEMIFIASSFSEYMNCRIIGVYNMRLHFSKFGCFI